MRKYGKLFTSKELSELRSQFSFVDTDKNGNHRLFFDNAGGSLRLKKRKKLSKKLMNYLMHRNMPMNWRWNY